MGKKKGWKKELEWERCQPELPAEPPSDVDETIGVLSVALDAERLGEASQRDQAPPRDLVYASARRLLSMEAQALKQELGTEPGKQRPAAEAAAALPSAADAALVQPEGDAATLQAQLELAAHKAAALKKQHAAALAAIEGPPGAVIAARLAGGHQASPCTSCAAAAAFAAA